MLTELYIKNYMIVDQLHLELKPGLSILSGETGAGKSILVDCVSLALGARADKTIIRLGQTQCEVTLRFDMSHIPEAHNWLTDQGFIDEETGLECLLTRTLNIEGRSRATLNGRPCALNLIREFAETLLVIHAQHDSQHLLLQTHQQHYIDQLGKHEPLLLEIKSYYKAWHQNEKILQNLTSQAATRADQLALLNYQLEELLTLNLTDGELESLHTEHQTLHQATSLITTLNNALNLTVDNERHNALQLIHQAITQLQNIHSPQKNIQGATELLHTARIHIQEANAELSHYREQLELNPTRLRIIEERLSLIHDLARKHHVSPEDLYQVTKSLQHKIEQLKLCDQHIAQLADEQEQWLSKFQRNALQLSKKRTQVAQQLSQRMTHYMQQLGMQGGEFKVDLQTQHDKISLAGLEKIIFLIKTNPGQTLQPLTKVVSGGELSRIALALQAILAETKQTPTFIFDEVDTGIGGKTAEIVGQLLHKLSKNSQVFCITHLAQVAKEGDHHYCVSKSTTAHSTVATIDELTTDARIQELARMLSGTNISKQTILHAKELLTHTKGNQSCMEELTLDH